ncbi:MAG: hypothetical protein CMJ46_00620 [Planctomyces sp.]|nr:hypothetical protein [Planctomyces sp.]
MVSRFDPTEPLPNTKHEAFVQALLVGVSAAQAYVSAGFKPSPSRASRLHATDPIQARLGHLRRHRKTHVSRNSANDEIRRKRQVDWAQVQLERYGHIDTANPLASRCLEELQAMARGERLAVEEIVSEKIGDGPDGLVKVTHS